MDTTTQMLMAAVGGAAYIVIGMLVIFLTDDATRGRVSKWCGESLTVALFAIILWPIVAPVAGLFFRHSRRFS